MLPGRYIKHSLTETVNHPELSLNVGIKLREQMLFLRFLEWVVLLGKYSFLSEKLSVSNPFNIQSLDKIFSLSSRPNFLVKSLEMWFIIAKTQHTFITPFSSKSRIRTNARESYVIGTTVFVFWAWRLA